MGLMDKLLKNKNPLKNLNIKELEVEKIRLEREEKLKTADVIKLAQQKKQLFEKGFNVTKAEQRTIARKIKETDRKIKLAERHLKTISSQILAANNMIYIHEQKDLLESTGIMSTISKMSQKDLNKVLGEVNIEQSVMEQGIDVVNTMFDTEFGLEGEMEEEDETQSLMDVWASGTEEESEELFSTWDKKQDEKDEELELN
jgi:hypothetical protein